MTEVEKEINVTSTPEEKKNCENTEDEEHDPHYDPIISLPEVEVPTLEEDETVMLTLRAKLYRYDSNETPPEWKERGTGNVKILHHKLNDTIRVVMRRDKTLKLCANHFINPCMKLKPSASCERAWVYSAQDFADATVKTELLAIKFANIKNAEKWKEVFEEAQKIVAKNENNKTDSSVGDKSIPGDSLKLNDSFEDDNKIDSSDKKEDNESSSPQKTPNEVTEKLSSMSIKETEQTS